MQGNETVRKAEYSTCMAVQLVLLELNRGGGEEKGERVVRNSAGVQERKGKEEVRNRERE
jgi:hypothetical protein